MIEVTDEMLKKFFEGYKVVANNWDDAVKDGLRAVLAHVAEQRKPLTEVPEHVANAFLASRNKGVHVLDSVLAALNAFIAASEKTPTPMEEATRLDNALQAFRNANKNGNGKTFRGCLLAAIQAYNSDPPIDPMRFQAALKFSVALMSRPDLVAMETTEGYSAAECAMDARIYADALLTELRKRGER